MRAYVFLITAGTLAVSTFLLLFQFQTTPYLQVTGHPHGRGYASDDTHFISSKNMTNQKIQVFIFFGTRPEIIKMAPVIQIFVTSNHFDVITVFTGQHPNLINPFLEIFEIKVDIWFENILQKNQSITDLISKIMLHSKKLVFQESDIWMVQGDTSTAFAIATVAFHHGLRIAHIEAGLRTFNMYSPFPEEFNRKTISSIATFHFAPTQSNKNNLLKEGIHEECIFVTGNTVIDAVKYLEEHNKTKAPSSLVEVNLKDYILVLITLHRRENIEMMPKLYSAIQKVPCSKCLFIVPVHPNPNAGKAARDMCETDPKRFLCVPPLSYEEVHWIMKRSQFVLTDSGGLQEEATWYQVPTLVLRESTERMEAVNAGATALVGQDLNLLRGIMTALLNKSNPVWKSMSKPSYPFGYGNTSQQILTILKSSKYFPTKHILLNHEDTIPAQNPERNLKQKRFSPMTIGVVLQVFKRNTLKHQLEAAAKQTMVPKTIVVLQNGHFVDVSKAIDEFRKAHSDIELQFIASSKNLRFHGRFHIAYMMNETYVSIWDDDMSPKRQWLEYCVQFSRLHGNALVGANGRTFLEIGTKKLMQKDFVGKQNDFVGHTWTLPREFLKYYIDSKMFTLHTGEDIQLSFALQKVGIQSWRAQYDVQPVPRMGSQKAIASWLQNQAPRELLFCKILKAGFKTLKCRNCQDQQAVDRCIHKYEKEAYNVEKEAQEKDKRDNKDVIWKATD